MDNQTEKSEMNPDVRVPDADVKTDDTRYEQEREKTRQLIVQCFDLLSEQKYDEYRSILNEHPKLHKKIRYVVLTEKTENDEIIQKTEKILKNARIFAETLNEISLFLFKE